MKGQPKGLIAAALANMRERFGFYIMMANLFFAFSISNNVPKIIFHLSSHFCAHFLRIPSLRQVHADTNLAIEKFHFSIFLPYVSYLPGQISSSASVALR